tara:strand:+ start:1255 stop:1680 length:426 start_codon:yes stop_codon:yes gene_type:complete
MRRRLAPLILLLAVFPIAACSTTATPDATRTQVTSPDAAPQADATAPAEPTDGIAAAAASADCTGYTQSAEAAPYAVQWGECTYEGTKVKVYEFASDDDYAAFLDSVSGFGIVEEQLVRTGSYVFAPNDQTVTDTLRASVG